MPISRDANTPTPTPAMAPLLMRAIDSLVAEAVAGRLGSVSDLLDSAESIADVFGGAADVFLVLLEAVAVIAPTTLMIVMVSGLISSLTYVV